MFTVHATKKLLERVKQAVESPVRDPRSSPGNWYGTVLFWRPRVVLLAQTVLIVANTHWDSADRDGIPTILSLAGSIRVGLAVSLG